MDDGLAGLDNLKIALSRTSYRFPFGRVAAIRQETLEIKGLSAAAAIGDRIEILARQGKVYGEVVAVEAEKLMLLPETDISLVRLGDGAKLIGPLKIAPSSAWKGRIVDPSGLPLDGRRLLPGTIFQPLEQSPPAAAARQPMGARLETSSSVFNTFLPIVSGQRIGLFAGSGVGKSSLLADLARHMEADSVVIALVGERGRELREFTHKVLGPEGMARSVVVAATSDQPALVRRRAAAAAMSVAEYFRDQGERVLLLVDSVTRFAEAHREVALAAGEMPALRGYPPSLGHAIMALCERAGPGLEGQGSITAVFSVLVAGSDMEEPVADILRGVLDGHVVLDRSIAERGRFPAIDLLKSVSRSLPDAATEQENKLLADGRKNLGAYAQSEMMIRAGLYAKGTDPELDRAIALYPLLDQFIARKEPKTHKESFKELSRILSSARQTPPRR